MFPFCKLALLLAVISSAAGLTRAQTPAIPVESKPGEVTPTSTIPDSTKLEPIKTHRAAYPLLAAQKGIQGQVLVQVHVSETGDVESVDVLSGDPILAESAVKTAKKWKFKPFIRNGKPVKVAGKLPFDFYFSEKLMHKGRTADGSTASNDNTVKHIAVSSLTSGSDGSSPDGSAESNAASAPKRVRVNQGVSQGLLVHQVAPVYPEAARADRIQGPVVLKAVIGKDGRLADLMPISGPKELIPPAIGAVQQWRYKPYLLFGEPVEVETIITINFRLTR